MGLSDIIQFFNKFVGSRKAALHDNLTTLTAKYAEALSHGRDTEAAQIKKQLDNLRSKGEFTQGDV